MGKKILGRPKINSEEEREKQKEKRRERRVFYQGNFLKDEPKPPIQRPKANYNNTSYQDIYNKYGV